jgi:CrcB protein
MLPFLIVALGSALGGAARYGVAELVVPRLHGYTPLPLQTLIVNVVGCYILSLVNETALRGLGLRPGTRLLLTTGFCGGLTTYSTFNYEVARLFGDKGVAMAGLYCSLTMVLCMLAHVLGVLSARALVRG